MRVRELIEELKKFDGKAQVLVSEDEELNTLYGGIDIVGLTDIKTANDKAMIYDRVIIYGLNGTEI